MTRAALGGFSGKVSAPYGDLLSASASITARRLAADHARPERPKVKISHVQYDSPGRDDRSNRSLNREWVEITNTGRRTVNLDGWTLKDEDGRTCTFDHYRLEGRTTVRIQAVRVDEMRPAGEAGRVVVLSGRGWVFSSRSRCWVSGGGGRRGGGGPRTRRR
ncbi:hypothetical protein GCM10010304_82550 [Streptomyces roseoviolaceus]